MRSAAAVVLIPLLVAGCSKFVPKDPSEDVADPSTDSGGPVGPASVCVGKVCSDGDDCTVDACDPASGECTHVAKALGTKCDDGLFCTVGEECIETGCSGGAPRECPGTNGGCWIGACDEWERSCVLLDAKDGAGCEDGDACTNGEGCLAGSCLVGDPIQCAEPDDPCQTAACDPQSGECLTKPLADNAVCDDDDPCTADDVCLAGLCQGVSVDCGALDEGCFVGVCDALTGICEKTTAPDAATCDDGQACTQSDACEAGVCLGLALDCSDLDGPCTEGLCNPGTGSCTAKNLSEETTCDDGDPCTGPDTCAGGECTGGPPPDCSALDGDCVVGVCDPATGACAIESFAEGGQCDDGDPCTDGDLCADGQCAGFDKDCSDAAGPCEKGFCDGGQCFSKGDGATDGDDCDDGAFCTYGDACFEGFCVGSPVDCGSISQPCLAVQCDDDLDACVPKAIDDGQPCDDGLSCTTGDSCLLGVCAGAFPALCFVADEPCKVGTCTEPDGLCESVPAEDGLGCDDQDPCTVSDVCSAGDCFGTLVDCSAITTDCGAGQCEGGICVTAPVGDGASCDDGLECTQADQCIAGVCEPGDASACPCDGPARSMQLGEGCVVVPGTALLQSQSGFTIELWLRTTSLDSAVLLDQRISEAVGENDWHIRYDLVGQEAVLRFRYGNVTGEDSQIGMQGAALNDGQWHHVAVTRDDKTMRWWVDGIGLTENLTTNIQPLDNDSDLTIGCSAFGGNELEGAIDELRISSFARYASEFVPPQKLLRDAATVALWHLDEEPGAQSITDVAGGNDGGVQGEVSFGTDAPPTLVQCCGDEVLDAGEECDPPTASDLDTQCGPGCTQLGAPPSRSLGFDGVDGCVVIDSPSLLSSVDNLTIGFWLRTSQADPARLLDKRITDAPGEADWNVLMDADGRLTFIVGNQSGGESGHTLDSPVNDGLWHHLAFVFSSVQVVRWYLDGEPGPTGQLATAKPLGNGQPLRVGCGLAGADPFQGTLDGLRISAELLYTGAFQPAVAPAPTNTTELLLTFDQPFLGGVVPDLSSGSHSGVLVGGAVPTKDVPP